MRKSIASLITAALMFGLCACGGAATQPAAQVYEEKAETTAIADDTLEMNQEAEVEATPEPTEQIATPEPQDPYQIIEDAMVKFWKDTGEVEGLRFTVNNKAEAFIRENMEVFPYTAYLYKLANLELRSGEIEYDDSMVYDSIDPRAILKNPANYSDKLIRLQNNRVITIMEHTIDEENGLYYSRLDLADARGQIYTVIYMGESLADVYKDDIVDAYGLTLGLSSYDNTTGGLTNTVIVAGTKVIKVN